MVMTGIFNISVVQECPKCHVTIEKNGGCNHMVCRNNNCKVMTCAWLVKYSLAITDIITLTSLGNHGLFCYSPFRLTSVGCAQGHGNHMGQVGKCVSHQLLQCYDCLVCLTTTSAYIHLTNSNIKAQINLGFTCMQTYFFCVTSFVNKKSVSFVSWNSVTIDPLLMSDDLIGAGLTKV